MSKQLKIGILMMAGALVFLLGVVYFGRASLKRSINEVRAERLYSQAEAAFEAELWAEAARKGTAAHYLDPDAAKIELLVARALLKQRSLDAVTWWSRVLPYPELPVDELRFLTRMLVQSGRRQQALPFLERLVELDGQNPETQSLWLFTLHSERQLTQSYALADQLVERGSEDWNVHQQYLQLQAISDPEGGTQQTIDHLVGLVQSEGSLALPAARELALMDEASLQVRLEAAERLLELSDSGLDRMLAEGIRWQAGQSDRDAVEKALETYLESDAENRHQQALEWALWMGEPAIVLEQLEWATYRATGAPAELYFQALMDTGAYQEVLDRSQQGFSEAGDDSVAFLVYRAEAMAALGAEEDAESTLAHAIRVVEPAQSPLLERYLMQGQQWEMLVELYAKLYAEAPDNADLVLRYLAALYYTGKQDRLGDLVEAIDPKLFESDTGPLAFLLYLKVLMGGFDPALHRSVEDLLAEYPEVFDFRLVTGFSYLLQGESPTARSFSEGMPTLQLSAPRYIRVMAALLDGQLKDRFGPAEMQHLLPRERYLLSQVAEAAPG